MYVYTEREAAFDSARGAFPSSLVSDDFHTVLDPRRCPLPPSRPLGLVLSWRGVTAIQLTVHNC